MTDPTPPDGGAGEPVRQGEAPSPEQASALDSRATFAEQPREWWERSIWALPAVVILAVAVIGQFLNGFWAGAVATAVVATAVGFLVAEVAVAGRRRFGVSVSVAVLVGFSLGGLMWWQYNSVSDETITPGVSSSAQPTMGSTVLAAPTDLAHVHDSSLRGRVMADASLAGVDWTGADASGITLTNANLQQAKLVRAVLRGADLQGACLRNADLTGADLSGADLSGADTTGATAPASVIATAAHWPTSTNASACPES